MTTKLKSKFTTRNWMVCQLWYYSSKSETSH